MSGATEGHWRTPLPAVAVADLLEEIGRRTMLGGERNQYRGRAYIRAAESLRALIERWTALSLRAPFAIFPASPCDR